MKPHTHLRTFTVTPKMFDRRFDRASPKNEGVVQGRMDRRTDRQTLLLYQTEDQEGTRRGQEQRWSHQEEPGQDSGFSCDSTTLKPIQAQPENFCKNSFLPRQIKKDK